MSAPMLCLYCGQPVGVCGDAYDVKRKQHREYFPPSPCNKFHAAPVYKERRFYFGLIAERRVIFNETRTEDKWFEYIGPKNHLLLFFAVIHMNDDLTYKQSPIYWSPMNRFYGRGYIDLFHPNL